MNDVKNKMYNYEANPPEGVWEAIVAELDRNEAKVIPLNKKKNYTFYYVAAATVAVILFCIIFFTNRSSISEDKSYSSNGVTTDTTNTNLIMTIPQEEKFSVKNIDTAVLLANNRTQKNGPNLKATRDAKDNTGEDSNLLATHIPRYITIEGPEGQPVKISSKMAMLIDSSETKIPTKPIWNKKINEWKEIMKGNTLAPTPGNFLDIVELTKSLKDNK